MERFVSVLTPVYLNVPERIRYLEQTLDSFYKNNFFPGRVVHYIVDDRSPIGGEELDKLVSKYGLIHLGRIDPASRKSFHDVYLKLIQAVETEFFVYLEPDHYFYFPYDFITPALTLYRLERELHQVYFRAPLNYARFRRLSDSELCSTDGTILRRVPIDNENTGWVGIGTNHETFSLMPSLLKTNIMLPLVESTFVEGGPRELEMRYATMWDRQKLVGYINGQAFCYHIGAAGKEGPGNYLMAPDLKYEQIWRQKDL